jgi:glucose/arabinose dehydrogenase
MKRQLVLAAILLALALTLATVACGDGEKEEATPTPALTPSPTAPQLSPTPQPTPSPVAPQLSQTPQPTPSPVAPQLSPTPEPTPTPSLPTEGAYELVPTLEWATFPRMVGLSTIPDAEDEVVVVTQTGIVWRGPLEGEASATVFGDVSDRLIDSPGNEEGLLGLAFSPDFPADGRVYLYYTAGNPRRSVLSRFQVVDGAMDTESERVLLEVPQPFSNHNGGQLAFGPDGYLYVALGDGGSAGDPEGNGQDLSTLLGSILRLDVSGDGYSVPADNPFAATAGARPEIYAYGLRNPWRFTFDSATAQLWVGDVGQDKWEEVDRIVPGGNYGWNIMEGLECFLSPGCDTSGLQMPRAVYGREAGCSVTGGYVYRGASMPELNGWYVYGDYCTGRIWAANIADDSPPVLLADTGLPIASFGELPDGELAAITFALAIYRLQRKP